MKEQIFSEYLNNIKELREENNNKWKENNKEIGIFEKNLQNYLITEEKLLDMKEEETEIMQNIIQKQLDLEKRILRLEMAQLIKKIKHTISLE